MDKYLNLSKELFIGLSTKEIDRIVKSRTGKDLKEIIYELYIIKEKSVDEIAEFFSFSTPTIRLKIREYGFVRNINTTKIAKPKKKIKLKKVKGTQINLINEDIQRLNRIEVNRVYFKTPKMIERETGKPFSEIALEYLEKGFSPSQIAKELQMANQSSIRQVLKKLEYSKQKVIYPNVFGRGKTFRKSEEIFKNMAGITLIEFFKKKYIEEGLSTYEIAPLFGTDPSTIHAKLKAYGLNRNQSEARKLLMEKGVIDYSQIHIKRTLTVEKENMESQSQKLAGELFHIHFAKVLSSFNSIEAIIGFNNWFILKDKEVDIPIVIIDPIKEKIYKIAIEYQAEHTHSSIERVNSDKEKEERLRSNDWIYFTIWDGPSFQVIENRVIEIVESIMTLIVSSN